MLRSKVFQGEDCSRKQTVLRGKVFQGAKCAGEQSVPKEQSVPERKVFISLILVLIAHPVLCRNPIVRQPILHGCSKF